LLAAELPQLMNEVGDLLRRLHVAAEEDDAAEIEFARQRAQLRGNVDAGKTQHDELTEPMVQGTG
jgi:hypothetical protein